MDTNKMAKVFKALSNPNRLELYLKIVENQETDYKTGGGCLICEIAQKLKIGSPTISHHLKELNNADLIFTERKGKFLIAKVNEEMVDDIYSFLKLNNAEELLNKFQNLK